MFLLLLALLVCSMTGFLPAAQAQIGVISFGWRPIGLASAPGRVVALAADPRNDSTLFVVAPSGGIWRSDNGGVDWSPQFDNAYSIQACTLALDPSAPDILYAGTGDDQSPRPAQGVARSTDGGRNWIIGTRFTNQPVCSLAVDPAKGSRVLAGSIEGLFLSNDSASTWRKVLSVPITSISFDGQGNIYAGELGKDSPGTRNNALARSADGGLTWTSLSLSVPPAATSAQTNWVTIAARGNTLYLVISYAAFQSSNLSMDFYSSIDGGATWTVAPAIGTANPPVSLVADASGSNLYITGTNLLTSQDQGVTWNAVTTTFGQLHAAVFTGSSLLTGGDVVLELVPIAQGGRGTQIVLPIPQFLDIAIDSTGNPWAAGPGGLFGHLGPGIFQTGIGSIAAATSATSQNIFASANSTAFHSTNLGIKFTSGLVLSVNELRAPYPPLAINPTNPATAYVAGQKLYRTINSGTAWSLLAPIDTSSNNVVTALAISPAGARTTMYAASACLPEVALTTCPAISIIWRSTNIGASWSKMGTVLGLVSHLSADPRQANTVYAAIGAFAGGPSQSAGYNQGDLLQSADGGATWISVAANLPRVPVNAIAIDPNSVSAPTNTPPRPGGGFTFPPIQTQSAQTIYVGTDAGVYVTFNAGTQWTSMSSGLPASPITQLLLQPAGTLSATTFGRGAFQAEVGGLSASLIANPLSTNVTLNHGASKAISLSLANNSGLSLNWQLTPLDPWISAPVSSGTLQPSGSASLTYQVSSTGLAIGTYLGRLQITNGTLTQSILVSLQVTTPPAAIAIVSGNNRSAAPGTTLPPMVVSIVDANGAPVPGAQVNFAISSGGGTLSTRTATSDSAGTARTSLTLPSTPGAVQVIASSGSLSATFTATAVLITIITPNLNANSVVNGVTFNSNTPASPGTILSIFGSNLAASSGQAAALPLTSSLQDTSVVLTTPDGDISLPLFFVSPQQINALLPYDLAPGSYSLRVVSGGVASSSVPITVAAYSPGIFTLTSDGKGMGIFLKADGSLVSANPPNPATAGSTITFFATGLGAVDPPLAAGAAGSSAEPLNRTVQTPLVFFDSSLATVLYSGLAPGFAGLYQVNVRVPAGVSSASNVSFSLSIGGITSNRVSIAVQ